MANVWSAHLAISHDHVKKLAAVTVRVKLAFTTYELKQMKDGLQFKCKCELWGADSGFNGADDKLYVLSPKYFPDASPSGTEEISFQVTLGEGVLDEDWGRDEVYAHVVLQNLFTQTKSSKNSNTVEHRF
jgi:hypothetical protein